MGNSKDERIKKLKRKRIWPSILGLFFITIVFALILAIQLEANILGVIQRKVLVPISQTEAVADLFKDYEGEHKRTYVAERHPPALQPSLEIGGVIPCGIRKKVCDNKNRIAELNVDL